MEKIHQLMDERIESEILSLDSLKPGSEEKTKTIADLEKLYKLRIEDQKLKQAESAASDERKKAELEQGQKRLDRWLNIGLQVGLAVGGWLCYDIWHRRGLKFEETGTVTSPLTRNLISRMLPGKK